MPHYQVTKPNLVQQADILFMPDDEKFKYILVVIDTYSKMIAAEPLKNKDSASVANAFKHIYKDGPLKIPEKLEVDPGSEFKGATKKWLEDHGVYIRVGEVGRHRQQAFVENANKIIGKILHQKMTERESVEGVESTEWKDDLPHLVKAWNTRANKLPKKKTDKGISTCSGDSCKLLNIGDSVRVALNFPIGNIKGERLFGKWRASDVRWEVYPRKITNIILVPSQPPMYQVDGKKNYFTKNQLQLVKEGEIDPVASDVLDREPRGYVASSIINIKKINGRWSAELTYKGYNDTSWEPLSQVVQDVPKLVDIYYQKHPDEVRPKVINKR